MGSLCWLHEYNLDLPVKQINGDTAWRRPSYSAIHRIIENRVYGGTYARRLSRRDTAPMV
ncbi:hypothetical protein [Bradyrhizobium sp. 190]|jgi:hypothetical protein|uniref:hypothetical protein n=1 Tax=Bradyrhizobium sp. 190 TaxID=2782658 RepID=UPI001FF9AE6A|nr:hypothetical protein [Bradyrhizobium sp. 190]